jgi:DNA-binding transcriptional LysR family regulator
MVSHVSVQHRIVKQIRCIFRRVRPLPDLSIRQLEYLVAVADSPSWAIAAERVGVSASALSQGLAELERRLGVALFERDGRRRRLRTSAQPAVSHARHVLGLTGDLADWADRIKRGAAGRLRLGMIDAAAIGHHSEVVRAFRDEHPDIDLRLRVAPSAPLLDLLISGELDLVVCVEPSDPIAGIDTEPVLTEQLAVYGPPNGDLDRPSTWGPWVLFPAGSHTRTIVAAALAQLGAPLEIAAESHQPDVVREMVRLGSGWTVLPIVQAEHGDRALPPGRPLTSRRLVIATRRDSVRDPVVDEFAQRIRQASTSPATARRTSRSPR